VAMWENDVWAKDPSLPISWNGPMKQPKPNSSMVRLMAGTEWSDIKRVTHAGAWSDGGPDRGSSARSSRLFTGEGAEACCRAAPTELAAKPRFPLLLRQNVIVAGANSTGPAAVASLRAPEVVTVAELGAPGVEFELAVLKRRRDNG